MPLRLSLAAAALATVAATAVPADAALQPVCAIALAADAVGTTARCTTNNAASLGYWSYRNLDVRVVAGTVDARLTCNGISTTRRLTAPESATLRLSVSMPTQCESVLTAVTPNPKATGLTTFAPRFFAAG